MAEILVSESGLFWTGDDTDVRLWVCVFGSGVTTSTDLEPGPRDGNLGIGIGRGPA
ncbi:unnamed protein product, partial [Allacma fusca]